MEIHRYIGDLLVDGGFATRRQVNKALKLQRYSHKHLADILLDQGILEKQEHDAVLRLQQALDNGEMDRSHIRDVLEHRGEIVGSLDERIHARLGELLLEHGDITQLQLAEGLREQRRSGERLDKVLLRLGYVRRVDVRRSRRLQRQLAAAACGAAITFSNAVAAGPGQGDSGRMLAEPTPAVAAAASATGGSGSSYINLKKINKIKEDRDRSLELRHLRDPALQGALDSMIRDGGYTYAVEHRQLSLVLVDITNASQPRMASVNGDHMVYAASLPKIAILLGAFEKMKQGGMHMTADVREELTQMIRRSSNTAASNMYHAVGPKFLAKVLQSDKYRFYDPEHNGGLWVGKEYGKGGAWKRDPMHNISHGATAMQVARFLYMMETGQLVSPEASQQMKQMLSRPAIEHKFVKGLNEARPGSAIFRKSGTWREYHSDCAIVERDGRRYIAVALAESSRGSKWLPELIVGMDDAVFGKTPAPTLTASR